MPEPLLSPRPHELATMTTAQVRQSFLIERVFPESATTGGVPMTFTDLDRLAVGGAKPAGGEPVALADDRETGTDFILARRELGVINIGGPGTARVDGRAFAMAPLDGLYVSMGSRQVTFASDDPAHPAKFYLVSCPAHAAHPTTHIPKADANPRALGSQATANQRKIFQYIHPGGAKSCQLVMGFTELAEGSVWNTMPPHTHNRRTEVYFYFDLGDAAVAHFLGAPQETRSVWVNNEQAVLSPHWSIHCGCGTAAYRFVWAMAGENQVFDDMDHVAKNELR